MKGALTYKDLDAMKRKAKALDAVRDYLAHADPEAAIMRKLVASGYENENPSLDRDGTT